jgi:hypothetical protein
MTDTNTPASTAPSTPPSTPAFLDTALLHSVLDELGDRLTRCEANNGLLAIEIDALKAQLKAAA